MKSSWVSLRRIRLASILAMGLMSALPVSTTLGQDAATAPQPALATAPPIAIPAPLGVPAPGPATDQPYAPQAILPGGIVIPLYPAGSPHLNMDFVKQPERYNMSQAVPGRIGSIVNIHNPSIEVHMVDRGLNTGAAVILAAGGGHTTLNVGGESADFVPYFYNYGINTIILRNRLRDNAAGYNPAEEAVNDAMQAIRMVRKHAELWRIDPNKIGIMGFSAGAELSAPAAIQFEEFDKANNSPSDPLAGVSSRPDFVGIVYPGPTPFARNADTPIPRNAPPAFIICAGAGDQGHARWANQYFTAMLEAQIPNVEMHIYGNGRHPGQRLPDGSNMSGGLTDRNGTPFGKWQDRYIEWFRDLGFMQKPNLETKAAKDIAAFVSQPPQAAGGRGGRGGRRGGAGRGGQPDGRGGDAAPAGAPASASGTPAPAAGAPNPTSTGPLVPARQ